MAEGRDRDVERAEALQAWLSGYALSGRARGALQRELEAIIADGTNGDHSLAGLTIANFVAELHSPNGGAVGRVKSVGDAVLNELRAAIPPDTRAPRRARKAADAADAKPRRRRAVPPEPAVNGTAPLEEATAPQPVTAPEVPAEVPQVEAPHPEVPQAEALEAEAPQAEAPQAEPTRRRPGRPRKNATSAASVPAQERKGTPVEAVAVEAVAAEPQEAVAPKRRGRPRRTEPSVQPAVNSSPTNGTKPAATKPTPAPVPIAAVENKAAPKVSEVDPVLAHIIRLWPTLHPQARQAVVHYASDLLGAAVQ